MKKTKIRIKNVNRFLLITVALSAGISELGVMGYVNSYGLRLLLSQLIIGLPMFSYILVYRLPFRKTIGYKRIRFSNILLSILFYFLIKNLMTFLNAITMVFTKNKIAGVMFIISEQVPFFIGIFLMAILPAFFEESVYRGIIYQHYRKADPLWALILSGLIFGLIHGNFNQFLYAFVFGVILALLNEATGSVISSMVVHFVTNLVSTVEIYLLSAFKNKLAGMTGTMGKLSSFVFGGSLNGYTDSENPIDADTLSRLLETKSSDILTYLPIYGLLAVGGTIGGFFVFRWIAKRNGRWEYIVSIFKRSKAFRTTPAAESSSALNDGAGDEVFACEQGIGDSSWIFSPQLILALIILVYELVFYELTVHGVV